MRLPELASVTLLPTSPFYFDGTVFNPSHFPGQGSHWQPGYLWMALRWQKRTYGIRLRDRGTVARPRVELTVYGRRKPSPDILSLYEYLVITVLLQNTVVRRSVSMLQAL